MGVAIDGVVDVTHLSYTGQRRPEFDKIPGVRQKRQEQLACENVTENWVERWKRRPRPKGRP